MTKHLAIRLCKERLGLSGDSRNNIISAIIDGIMDELENVHKINLDLSHSRQLMFIVDLAVWRYQSRGESGAIPRNLQLRLHNLLISDRV